MAILTIDWEPWDSFKVHHEWENTSIIEEPTMYLLDILRRHQIKAIWYCVGWLAEERKDLLNLVKINGHIIGDHTYYHSMNPKVTWSGKHNAPFRAPRWQGEKRLYSGGFWFRAMPYKWVKREVEKTGIFFVHPYDLLFEHPDCGNPIKNFERRLGLKTSRDKLERLCREVTWNEP